MKAAGKLVLMVSTFHLQVFILIFPQLLIVPDKMETTCIDEQNVGKSLFSQMKDTNTPTGNVEVNWLSKGQISKVKIGFFQLSVITVRVNVQSKG